MDGLIARSNLFLYYVDAWVRGHVWTLLILLTFLLILLFYRVALAHRLPPQVPQAVLPFDRRKSTRLMMSVPVLVYGRDSKDAPFIEIVNTSCVNSHGGVVSLDQPVEAGQTILVANIESPSGNEQQCRIVHVCNAGDGKRSVGFAFGEPEHGFWGLEYDARHGQWHTAEQPH